MEWLYYSYGISPTFDIQTLFPHFHAQIAAVLVTAVLLKNKFEINSWMLNPILVKLVWELTGANKEGSECLQCFWGLGITEEDRRRPVQLVAKRAQAEKWERLSLEAKAW